MVKDEYLRFLQALITNDVSIDVRKIANLVLQHIDTLIPLSTAQGQRVKKIVEVAQKSWSSISSDIQLQKEQAVKQTCPFTKIKSLAVGPFRGFTEQVDFDLTSQLVLIYGPNGTGKSSFCEALEYGLLGNVIEAEIKRFRNQSDYLKNAHAKRFSPPILIGMDSQGNDIRINANEALYRFCFIEKNRIDNFSRIAAQAPAKQTELISTLFGLDAFTEFVRNFTDSMDKYIDIIGVKAKDLSQKQQVLAGYQQHLITTPEEITKVGEDENMLAETFRSNLKYSEMVQELNGSEGNNGSIAQLEAELEKPVGIKSNLTLAVLQTLKQSSEANIQEQSIKQQELANASQDISYKKLYEAVIEVKENSQGHCPACHTPLSHVSVNPFEHANTELKKLQHLGELQEAINTLNSTIGSLLFELSQIINTCCSKDSENTNILSTFQMSDGKVATVEWWNSLHQQLGDGLTPWQYLETQIRSLEDADKEIVKAIEQRTVKQNELKRLRKFAEDIVILQTRRNAANCTISKANDEIAKFGNDNARLIAEVEAEKSIVAQNQKIANAYANFVQKLNEYNNNLPVYLIADLGEMIVQLYNAFNRHDGEHEQLASVRLPLQQNQRLEISYNTAPDSYYDALHILSEGHIRCIGLAILTAKNIKEGCSFLVFDDPVNAIDDEHRESIRKTVFEDIYFKDKQIILACHGEEFFKDIQNLLRAEKARQVKTFSFLPKINNSHIRVDQNCSSRNYIVASRSHFNKNEIRDALDKSRKALESLAKDKVWHYIKKYSDGKLNITLYSPKAPIELRNLAEQLKSKIAKTDFSDQNKNAVLIPLETLVGISGDSREWRYLNKGTHEEADREEFDRETVNKIISALEQLDAAI